jgi:UDP-glucose 4-epimerase
MLSSSENVLQMPTAKKRFLVLGGAGFLGTAISKRLLSQGHRVSVFEREQTPLAEWADKNSNVMWLRGDFLNRADVAAAVSGVDVVVHAVSSTNPGTSSTDPVFDVQTNLVATLHLLGAIADGGTASKIVYLSSGGTVYGIPKCTPIMEDHPTEPLVAYGITKLAIEKHLAAFEHRTGIRCYIARVSNPYGPGQRASAMQGAVGVFLAKGFANESVEIWGDGSVVRDYIFVDDVADFIATLDEYQGCERIFNVGSGVGVSLLDLLDAIETQLGFSIKRTFLPKRLFDVPSNVLSIERARVELSWSPQLELSEGLKRTVAHLVGIASPSHQAGSAA